MDTYDSLTSEYYSLPPNELVHNYNDHNGGSNQNKEISENKSSTDSRIYSSGEISHIQECSSSHNVGDHPIKEYANDLKNCERRKCNEIHETMDGKCKADPTIRNDSNIGLTSSHSRHISLKEGITTCQDVNKKITCNKCDKGYSFQNDVRNDENPKEIETSQHSDNSEFEEPDSLHDASPPQNNESPGRVTVAIQVPRIRSPLDNNAISAPASLTHCSSLCLTNDLPQRPSSLPLGSPPSYMEALRCSPLSLPYDLNISQSRTSLYALNNSTLFNNVYDYFLDMDSANLERTPRLLALPSFPAIHTISRSASSTPSATPDDAVLEETIIPTSEGFDSHPCAAFCKACQITVLTTTTTTYRSTTYCCCFLMFFSGVCCPFSFLPFFLCGPKKVFHMCPQCKNVMGICVDKD